MIYVVEFLIDDGQTKLEFYEAPQDAHARFERAINPITGGANIRGGKGAFVEEVRLLSVQTEDRGQAKRQVQSGEAEVVRDSAAEREAFEEELARSLNL